MAIISTSHKFIYLILFSLYVFFTPPQVVNFSEYKKKKEKKESFVMNKMKIFKTFKEFSLVFLCQTNFSAPLCFQLFFRGNQFSRKSSAKDFVTDAFTCDSLYNCCSKSHRFQRGSLAWRFRWCFYNADSQAPTLSILQFRSSTFFHIVFLIQFSQAAGRKAFSLKKFSSSS